MKEFLPCLYAFIACIAFCFIFEMRRWQYILCAGFASAISWLVYLILPGFSEVARCFVATIAVAILAEIFARIFKCPATVFLVIGIIPLVPGGGIYYTMEYGISGDTINFLQTGLHTFGIAGSLALGILVVSSIVRFYHVVRRQGTHLWRFGRSQFRYREDDEEVQPKAAQSRTQDKAACLLHHG